MSKIEKLIAQYCPDGVEYLKIEDVIISLKTGLNPRKNFKLNTEDAKNYYVTVREIVGNSIRFHDKTDKVNDDGLRLINNRSKLEKDDILFSGTGTIGRVALVKESPGNWDVKEGIYILKPNQLKISPSFLLYLLNAPQIIKHIQNKVVGSPVCSVPMSELKKILIPIPPLPVQEEIVKILDKFTAFEAELEAELEARKRQYEYYRNELLSFKGKDVEWKTLGDVCQSISAGGDLPQRLIKEQEHPSIEFPYPIYANAVEKNGLYGFTDDYKIESEAVTISARGAKIGFHTVRLGKYTPIVRLISLIPNRNLVITRYLNYSLDVTEISGTKGGIPQLTVPTVKKIKIPIPPLQEQERIVSILDKFDALVNDISVGLPAEISARRQQYEYYRGKLLTFEPLAVAQ